MKNPTIDKKAAKRKLDRILDEIRSGKTFLTCGRHNYVAYSTEGRGVMPPTPNGCHDCWQAYYTTLHCQQDPANRYEDLLQLEEVVHHTVEFQKTGKFGKDFELYLPGDPRFKVEVGTE